jgi:hypothetical protein
MAKGRLLRPSNHECSCGNNMIFGRFHFNNHQRVITDVSNLFLLFLFPRLIIVVVVLATIHRHIGSNGSVAVVGRSWCFHNCTNIKRRTSWTTTTTTTTITSFNILVAVAVIWSSYCCVAFVVVVVVAAAAVDDEMKSDACTMSVRKSSESIARSVARPGRSGGASIMAAIVSS